MKNLMALLMAVIIVLTGITGFALAEPAEEDPFSLWNPDAAARNALVEYLAAVTDEASPDYIPVKDRIAVFDLDGTLMCETDPFCFEYMVFADNALNHAEDMPEEVLAVAREILDAAGSADFCIALYNPSSIKRADYLQKACDILLRHKSPETVCGTVRNIGREGEAYQLMTLQELRDTKVDMFTTVFIGNSQTKAVDGRMVTPRGYKHE